MTQDTQDGTQHNDDYEVGFRKPPKEHQYKPGVSGNYNGRPPGSKSLSQILKTELNEKVSIREGAKTRKISKKEVLVKRLVKDAADGKASAMRDLMALIAADEAKDAASGKGADLSPTGRALIEELMAKAGLEDPK